MLPIKTIAVAGLTALLFSTSLALAAPARVDPGPSTPAGPDNNKPFPEFSDPQVADDPVQQPKFRSTCAFTGHYSNGTPVIMFKNTGSQTIPKGSLYVITWPDGTTQTVSTPWDIPPGGSFGVNGPLTGDDPGFTCSVKIKVTEPGPKPPKQPEVPK